MRPAVGALALFLASVAAACGTSSGATQSAGCAARYGVQPPVLDAGTVTATSNVITIDARDFAFSPTCILGVPRGKVTLVVHNTGTTLHNLSIAAQHIDRDLAAGATANISVSVADTPVIFTCKYHRTIGMVGVLVPSTTPRP